jgi:DNA-directed RNA polymerase specialized sigma24 family protein
MPTAAATLPDQAVDDAFERLFREHHAFVYRTAYSVTGARHDAEDVLQTIFLRLLRRWDACFTWPISPSSCGGCSTRARSSAPLARSFAS